MLRRSNKQACLTVGLDGIALRTPRHAEIRVPRVDEGIAETIRLGLSRAAAEGQALRRLDVEVEDVLVYLDVLEIDARVTPPAEVQRLAALALADTYGLEPHSFTARCSVQRAGTSVVACALPQATLDAVTTAFDGAGVKAGRIQPAFARFLERHAKAIGRQGVAARLGGSCLTLGFLERGNWKAFAVEFLYARNWIAIRSTCESFCRRLCLEQADTLPVWLDIGDVDADGGDGEDGQRWHFLHADDRLKQEAS